jgi:hypothetical protein
MGAITASADHHKEGEMADKKGPNPMPKTVIHVVTVSWKAEATEAQIQAALDGVHALNAAYDGITRTWTRTVKAQGDRSHAFVMEFKNEKALKDYAGSQAQKDWYEVYYLARGGSTTFDISN